MKINYHGPEQAKTPMDFKEHFLDEWTTINSPTELAEKFEEYEDIKGTLRQKPFGTFDKGRQEFKLAEKSRRIEPRRSERTVPYWNNLNRGFPEQTNNSLVFIKQIFRKRQ